MKLPLLLLFIFRDPTDTTALFVFGEERCCCAFESGESRLDNSNCGGVVDRFDDDVGVVLR